MCAKMVNLHWMLYFQPAVCSRELCIFSFQTLGVMADATEEIATSAEVSYCVATSAEVSHWVATSAEVSDPYLTRVATTYVLMSSHQFCSIPATNTILSTCCLNCLLALFTGVRYECCNRVVSVVNERISCTSSCLCVFCPGREPVDRTCQSRLPIKTQAAYLRALPDHHRPQLPHWASP